MNTLKKLTPLTKKLRSKFSSLFSTAVIAGTSSIALSSAVADAAPIRINGIAAKANGRVITQNEVAFLLAPRVSELAARFPRRGEEYVSAVRESKDKILNELIDQQLIIHEFNSIGAQIPQFAVTQKVNEHILNNYNGDEKLFRSELASEGLSFEKFEKLTKERLIGQATRSQHFNDAAPATPAEIKAEYNKNKDKLRDKLKDKINFEKMYIPKENNDDLLATPETQLVLAEDLIKRINAGENFANLAKEFSHDGFAAEGGMQENKARTDLSPAIGTILFTEKEGTVIGPLEDSNGYHIIRVTKKIPGPPVPLEKVKNLMEREVQNRKSSARFNRYLDRLRKRAMIKIY